MADGVGLVRADDLGLLEWEEVLKAGRPVVVAGISRGWPALDRWSGEKGLDRLGQLAGGKRVQVLEGSRDGAFYGSILRHRRSTCTFGDFLEGVRRDLYGSHVHPDEASGGSVYLAQAPIQSAGITTGEPHLAELLVDLGTPDPIRHLQLAACNLWINSSEAHSSTHYDPYHNFLCVVSGFKRATLYSPEHAAALYPQNAQAVYGEASNHSSVDFLNPDLDRHPLYAEAKRHAITAAIQPGDALFIPEGWWHQLSSEEGTIAVNYWWQSDAAAAIGGTRNAFFLREALAAAVAVEKDRLLKEVVPYNLGLPGGGEERLAKRRRESWEGEEAKEEGESSEEGGQSGGEAEAEEDDESEEGEGSEGGESREAEMRLTAREEKGMRLLAFHTGILQEPQGEGGSSGPTDDCPSRVIAALDPPELRRVLLSMARRTPRTLEAMLLFGLTPLATELMTRSFEAGDVAEEPGVGKCGVGEAGPGFYEEIYSVCEDKALVMQAMVGRKEALSKEACRLVLVRQLCMTSDLVGPPPTAFPE